jgi:hypothetical protein
VDVADAGEAGFLYTGSQAVSLQTEKAFREQLKTAPSRDIGEIKLNRLKEAPHFAQLSSYAKFANARKRSCRAGKFAANVQEPA